jgi:hypothetical protein
LPVLEGENGLLARRLGSQGWHVQDLHGVDLSVDRPDPGFNSVNVVSYELPMSNRVNLSADETSLVDQTAPEALARMDEKSVKELQSRLRKVRDKNFDLLRRRGAARVEAEGGRGAAEQANQRRGDKVDVLDEALARVNERLEALRDDS